MQELSGVELAEYAERSSRAIEAAQRLFGEVGLDAGTLPEGPFGDGGPVSLVFAGQYSAGKSTILKALTGAEDIETGHGVTTQEARAFDWHGIEVIDTPGIGTGTHPEHDAISYKAISDADLLVYVVTYSLFDSLVGRDFRDLIIDRGKAEETVLVVNKMRDADMGNTEEQRAILARGLAEVTDPYTPEQLRVVFVDALAYLRSREVEADNPGRARRLLEQSNFGALADALNGFVEQRGVTARLTTPLYQLHDALDAALLAQEEGCGDEDLDALSEQLRRERSIVSNTMHGIEAAVRRIYTGAAAQIRQEGRRVADAAGDCRSEADAEELGRNAQNRVETIAEDCGAQINEAVQREFGVYQDCLDDFYASDLARELEVRLEAKQRTGNPLVAGLLENDVLGKGGELLAKLAKGADPAAKGLKAFAGSPAKEMVLEVGHFFGHSFKPWEAAKWAKGIGVAGKALGVAGAVVAVGAEVADMYAEQERQRKLREDRDRIRVTFNEAADALERQCRDGLQRLLDESEAFRPRVDAINRRLDQIDGLRSERSEVCRELRGQIEACQGLIDEMHRAFPAGGRA